MSLKPAEILNIDRGYLSEGAYADVTIFDLKTEWIVDKEKLESKSKNSPFLGWRMKGQATDVLVDGRHILQDGVLVANAAAALLAMTAHL